MVLAKAHVRQVSVGAVGSCSLRSHMRALRLSLMMAKVLSSMQCLAALRICAVSMA